MKLFITNKDQFDNIVGEWSGTVHRRAFNQLLKGVGNGNAPEKIMVFFANYTTVLSFKSSVQGVYFYEFTPNNI